MFGKFNQKEKIILKISALFGLIFGIIVDIGLLSGPLTGLQAESNTYIIQIITVSAIVIQNVSLFVLTIGFTWVYMTMKVNRWLSIAVGYIGGYIAGGISFGLTMATIWAIAVPAKLIQELGTDAFVNTLPWWKIFCYTFPRAFGIGGFIGAIVGAVAGLIISVGLGYGAKKQK